MIGSSFTFWGRACFLIYCSVSGAALGFGDGAFFGRMGAIGIVSAILLFSANAFDVVDFDARKQLNEQQKLFVALLKRSAQVEAVLARVTVKLSSFLGSKASNELISRANDAVSQLQDRVGHTNTFIEQVNPWFEAQTKHIERVKAQSSRAAKVQKKFEISLLLFATIQWGFGDLVANRLLVCGEWQCSS